MGRPVAWNREIRTLARIAHCEGVTTGPDGMLWAGDETGRLFRIDPLDGSFSQVADVGGMALGLCLDGEGRVYVCLYDRRSIVRLDPASGNVEVYCDSVEGEPLSAPNWCLFAPDGTLYVSDSCRTGGELDDTPSGRLVAIPPGGEAAAIVPTPPLFYPNGMALAADGTLFVVESFHDPRVIAIRDGEVSLHARLPDTVPDGLALDEDGGLLVSCFQPNVILRVPPGGTRPEVVVDDWTGQRLLTPTNITFFGPSRRSLAIASFSGTCLYAIDTPWRGQPLIYPNLVVSA